TSVSDVYVEDVLSLTTHLESSLGDIVVKNSEGEFNIKNDIGNIEFSGSNPKGNITAQTDLGDIILQIGNKENASIYATSDLGDVTIYGSNIESFVVKEANYIVDVKTNIGDIKVSTY
ncbi:MAG TPA: DUF4097 family beta strand repeat-containing protein, partial [Bacillota bacterium]|nr:DUF4097 family beta strand repeat-containing protein [Bacillota bacterium]